MDNKKNLLVLDELRNRINNLKNLNNDVLFFEETANLVGWLENLPSLSKPLGFLELQKRKKDEKVVEILRGIYSEGKLVWGKIQKIPINLENIPEPPSQALALMKQYYDMGNVYNTIWVYHQVRILVEYLAYQPHSDIIANYFSLDEETKTPLIKGKIYNLFLEYSKMEDALKKETTTTDWGSWDNLKFVNYLCSREDSIIQIKDWSKVNPRDEYLVHLYRISNYLFDWFVLDTKVSIYNNPQFLDFAIWNDEFKFKNNIFKVGIYGEVEFHPEKSPMKINNEIRRNPTELFVEALVQAKNLGIDKVSLAKKSSIAVRDIGAYLNNINRTFNNALKSGKVKAIIEAIYIGEKGNPVYKLIVVPYEKNISSQLQP